MTTSNLSKIKPSLRTTGQVTGNFGRPKVRAANNSQLGYTASEHYTPTTQDEYLNRMYRALDLATDDKIRSFCYNEIKRILIQRGLWTTT